MKTIVRIIFLELLLLGLMAAASAPAADPVGKWKFQAPTAPYEYQEGYFEIQKEGKELKGAFLGPENSKMAWEDLQKKGNTLTFGAYFEGEYVSFNLTFEEKAFKGEATYSEGTVELSGEKIE
ncbi:hypothetical protein R9C00_23110 [Flammeovirgaceae bacterium SG7u.111]|nr:hypothetical protein [Flammeovirgaceae bacterium SG7u.132]WPO34595.1 hypothetical protein R9C00_23110 [Flammeovirgaceae bacterium SG7u.111]